MSIDAMKLALHTLEGWANHGDWVWPESALEQAKRNTTESITALRAAIEQPRQWQGLTQAEKVNVAIDCGCADVAWMDFADAIEAKLKEKNT
jgi:hypothetical protein